MFHCSNHCRYDGMRFAMDKQTAINSPQTVTDRFDRLLFVSENKKDCMAVSCNNLVHKIVFPFCNHLVINMTERCFDPASSFGQELQRLSYSTLYIKSESKLITCYNGLLQKPMLTSFTGQSILQCCLLLTDSVHVYVCVCFTALQMQSIHGVYFPCRKSEVSEPPDHRNW